MIMVESGGKDNADGSKDADLPFLFQQFLEIDMERAGKKEETQHADHQRLVEINIVNHAQPLLFNAVSYLTEMPQNDHNERHQDGDKHQAYRRRQFDIAVVQIAEQCG